MYARDCEHVTELGARSCVSTWGLLKGLTENNRPIKKLKSVDLNWAQEIDRVREHASTHGIDYTFRCENDLECTPEPTDMTFIDTWHVYGQLKRELALYAPITKKYIAMHDTEVDAIHGESVRCGLTDTNGLPEEETRQGLQRAIVEFLSWNDDWVIDRVWTNNNGLTVLRRQRPLFLVTSVIHVPISADQWQSSIYSPAERYEQTLETIRTIREKVPFARVVVLEGSAQKVCFETVDAVVHRPVNMLEKSVGEVTLLLNFLENYTEIVERSSIIVKISGRYLLSDSFDLRRFSNSKLSINRTIQEWSRNDDKTWSLTMLFAFPPRLRDVMIQRLKYVQSKGYGIEENITYGFHDFKNVDVLGVRGALAPTGEIINY
jgi:hypothetical protein